MRYDTKYVRSSGIDSAKVKVGTNLLCEGLLPIGYMYPGLCCGTEIHEDRFTVIVDHDISEGALAVSPQFQHRSVCHRGEELTLV